MNQTFTVKIGGYWREKHIASIPSHSGVYFVYVGTYNASTDSLTLHKLIYIGESEDVNDRISNHEKWTDWKKHVGAGQELCFSTGPVPSANRLRVEAAYIYQHKPVENTEYKYSFPFDQTTVISSGRTVHLNTNFTVYRTNR